MELVKQMYEASRRRRVTLLLALVFILVIVSLLSLSLGAVWVPPEEVLRVFGNALFPQRIAPSESLYTIIITRIRSPRIILAIVTGCSLGVAGTVMQATLRNPLVSPFTLGLSSAAAFGAALMIVMGPVIVGSSYDQSWYLLGQVFTGSEIYKMLAAFVLGILSMLLVFVISKSQRNSVPTMILAGVVLSYLFQAGIMFLKYVSDNEELREVALWLMGGLGTANWATVLVLVPVVLVCTYFMLMDSNKFNALGSGEDVAQNLGVDVERLKKRSLLTVALSTSACMAFTGVIGFIGLMAPHICRMLIGNDHRYLIPCSALTGAVILLLSDSLGRVLMAPEEMPVGIIMYLIGGAFFLFLVYRGKGKGLE